MVKADKSIARRLSYSIASVKLVGQEGEDLEPIRLRQSQHQDLQGDLIKSFDSDGRVSFESMVYMKEMVPPLFLSRLLPSHEKILGLNWL